MSGLRRSRPEDQDESLKRLQEISVARMEADEPQGQCSTSIKSSNTSSYNSESTEHDTETVAGETTAVDKSSVSQLRLRETEILNPDPTSMDGKIRALQHPQLVVNRCDEQCKTPTTFPPPNKTISASLSPTLPRLIPPLSPSFRCMSNSSLESAANQKSVCCGSSSPSSPSRKYFKFLPPPALLSADQRRGSEPILDSVSRTNSHRIQKTVADNRWNKLRSMLEAMKNEPFDVDRHLKMSTRDSPALSSEKVDCYDQIFSLQTELATVQNELHQKDLMHSQLLKERNAALAYIRLLKLNSTSQNTEDIPTDSVPQEEIIWGFHNLKAQSVSKGEVMSFLVEVVEELKKERNLLNQLMAVVLHRAPWMLEELDRSCHQDFTSYKRMSEKRDFDDEATSTDDEVWC